MKTWSILALFLGLAALGGFLLLSSQQSDSRPAQERVVIDPHGSKVDEARTLLVTLSQPAPSSPGALLHGRLVEGEMPEKAMMGTVLTDEDCGADFRGVSNCLNRVVLADGSKIAVRHPHAMSEVPCLAPGEPVRVQPSGSAG